MPESFRLEYTIEPSTLIDATRLQQSEFLARYRVITAAVGLGGVLVAVLYDPVNGLAIVAGAVALLVLTWTHAADRWLARYRGRSIIGSQTVYVVDDVGIHYEHPLGSGLLPWSALTTVRANDQTVVLSRDRVLAAYVPTSSFASAAEREAFIAFARAHIDAGPGAAAPPA